ERISKKRTKNEAKTTKPDTEWKSMVKTKSRQSPSSEHNHRLVGAHAIAGAANPTADNQIQIADYLQKRTRDSTMYGFRGGPARVTKGKYVKLTDEFVYPYTNQPLLAQEEEQVNDTLQKIIGKGKKVKLEQKVARHIHCCK
ncbi:hypothetical protein Tco_1162489, partial [Tanacetum coccineum]